MKPIYQRTSSRFGETGDCFQACVASIFNLRLDHVPNFYEGAQAGKLLPEANKELLRSWLKGQGCGGYVEFGFAPPLSNVHLEIGERIPDKHYILIGSANIGSTHAVVCRGRYVVHDPATSPGHHTIERPCNDGFYRVGLFLADR